MAEEQSDHSLLASWAKGDKAAGNELVRRHFDGVYGFVRSKVEDRPEDLVQRTFEVCLERADRYWESASFRAFLFGIARRIVLRHFRDRAKMKHRVSLGEVSVDQLSGTPSQVIATREEHKLLLAALRRIPLDFQITLELFYWESASIEEIAEVLEIKPGTVKSRLGRGRAALREALENMNVSDQLRRATLDDLSGWARGLQRVLARRG